MVPQSCCAFIQFTSRDGAERAAEKTFDKLVLKDMRIRVRWGINRADSNRQQHVQNRELDPVPNIPTMSRPDFFGLRGVAAPPVPPKRPANDALESSSLEKRRLFVPQVASSSGSHQSSSGSKIHYPSQDPHRLGSKGDVID